MKLVRKMGGCILKDEKKSDSKNNSKEVVKNHEDYSNEEQASIRNFINRSRIKPLKFRAGKKKESLELEGDEELNSAKLADTFGISMQKLNFFYSYRFLTKIGV